MRSMPSCATAPSTCTVGTTTPAAVGALSQLARSPSLRRLFPDDARRYRSAAEHGWAFLQRAWQAHGRAGAYQKLNGAWEPFGDVDWVAWAAVETWIASGST